MREGIADVRTKTIEACDTARVMAGFLELILTYELPKDLSKKGQDVIKGTGILPQGLADCFEWVNNALESLEEGNETA